ncbi:hypothetical protein K466DRAFT_501669 [Polyporus arcularius HHB13444]|uniref:Uncharacterized protein n=1 Tax=Polyporus arcularius HHB13444 TaxID=1314778 RepID=A0A5C3NY71_9APHY|nr:hypothetical protein K466DRAFT_501669 [Polyporus arcularius HHB13444]
MSSPFTYDDSSSDSLFDSFIDSSSFDQSFCSNFSCCGQNLPDLHRLLEHFEEEHVLPLPHDDRPLYSSPVYAQPRPSGAHASYIISYPQPDPPLQPVTHPIPHHGAHRVLPDIDLPHIRNVPDLIHSPLSSAASSATSCYSSPTLDEPLCLPPALFTVQNTRSRTPPPSSDSDDDDDDEPTPRERGRGVGPQRTTKQYGSARVDPIARSRPTVRTPERAPAPAHKKRDGREKQYKCPSYLNPNGLKYHLEKGTCTNADTRPRGPLPPPAESSPQTQTQTQTQTKTPALPSTVKIDVIDVPSGRSVIDVDAHSDDEADRT